MKETDDIKKQFAADVLSKFSTLNGEISERNQKITLRDQYVYGDLLSKSLDIPIGHDRTSVNWLRRTVEIHKNMFMSRGFQVISTYDSEDPQLAADEEDQERIRVENQARKTRAEQRKQLIDAIKYDNGGDSLWAALAETASAVADAAIKMYWDGDTVKLVPIESIENFYALWSSDNFREVDAYAFVNQISRQNAIDTYGVSEDVPTSPLGQPLILPTNTYTMPLSNQPMVTVMEVTGKVEGWASDKGNLKKVPYGKETTINAVIVGNEVVEIEDDPKKIPHYYVFPNKRQRRRPWGVSDISDSAIEINQSYIETLSDWRTVGSKVNFQKFKAYGFGLNTQMPKSEPRKTQMIPLSEGQDIVRLDQGDSNQIDFRAQMDELKEQFVRETGISRVLFDDPSVTLNSNQALLTSMKPTSDIAEAKKQLWAPIITQMFSDALDLVVQNRPELADITTDDDNWTLKVMWPSLMQKEDPVFQQMLLNRFNAGTMSIQSYLEAQGESKEELDRLRDELGDPITAAILGRVLNQLALNLIQPPAEGPAEPKVNVSLRGDLTPYQEANLATQHGFNDGPFPATAGPQGSQGMIAQENADNAGFLTAPAYQGGTPIQRGPNGNPVQGTDTNTGQTPASQVNTQANNQEGTGAVSQPGSGATPVTAQGALNQQNQQIGQ